MRDYKVRSDYKTQLYSEELSPSFSKDQSDFSTTPNLGQKIDKNPKETRVLFNLESKRLILLTIVMFFIFLVASYLLITLGKQRNVTINSNKEYQPSGSNVY